MFRRLLLGHWESAMMAKNNSMLWDFRETLTTARTRWQRVFPLLRYLHRVNQTNPYRKMYVIFGIKTGVSVEERKCFFERVRLMSSCWFLFFLVQIDLLSHKIDNMTSQSERKFFIWFWQTEHWWSHCWDPGYPPAGNTLLSRHREGDISLLKIVSQKCVLIKLLSL